MANPNDLTIQIKADIKDLKRKLDKVNKDLKQTGKKGSKSMTAVSKGGKKAGAAMALLKTKTLALVAAFVALGKMTSVIARVGSQFEDLKDSLDVVFGSMKAGDAAMKRVFKFAQTTPFQIETATKAFIALKSAGLEPNNEQLQVFADTASVSVDQLGTFEALIRTVQRSAAGGMGLEELNMISDRGIDVLGIFKRELGLTKDDLAKFGKTAEGAAILVKTLTKGLKEQFGGAMATKMDNLSVKTSNMTIAFKLLAQEIFESGLGQFLKDLADRLTRLATAVLRMKQATEGRAIGIELEETSGEATEAEIRATAQRNIDALIQRQNALAMANKHLLEKPSGLNWLKESQDANLLQGGMLEGTWAGDTLDMLGLDAMRTKDELIALAESIIKAREDENVLIEEKLKLLRKVLDVGESEATLTTEQLLHEGENINLLEQSRSTYEKTLDPLRDIRDLIKDEARLIELAAIATDDWLGPGGKVSIEEFKAAMEKLIETTDEAGDAFVILAEVVAQNVQNFTTDFVDALIQGESALDSFANFCKNIVSQIISTFLQLAVVNQILNTVFGNIQGWQNLPTMTIGNTSAPTVPTPGTSGGAFPSGPSSSQHGGTIQARQPYMGGESGPEIFIPHSGGTLLNSMNSRQASAGGGSSIVVNQSLNFATGVVPTVRTEITKMLPQIAEVTKASVFEAATRGGQFRKAMQGGIG